MDWDFAERRKRERNYRYMFRSALAVLAVGVIITVFGGVRALVESDGIWLAYGLMMVVWSTGSAWLTVDSTVKIIELDTQDARQARG